MLIGYNNDVQYRGKTFHIQTEDRGVGNESIESQLFSGGQILDTKITKYTEYLVGLEGDDRDKKLKALMQASHRSLFKKLMAGEYNALVGLEPVEGEDAEVAVEDFTPSQERVPAGAALVEAEGEEAFHDPSGGQHVDLSQLKNKLSGLGSTGDDDDGLEEESDEPATQVMSLPPDMNSSSYNLEALKKGAAKVREEAEREAKAAAATTAALEKGAKETKETRASIAKTSPVAAMPRPMTMPKPKLNANANANDEGIPELRPTGVRAWQGFEPLEEDLSIVSMVEAFLQL